MKSIVFYLTIIPWLLYFASLCKNALKDLKSNEVSWSWIKSNIFKIFHFETLILLAIFIYFSAHRSASQIWLTDVMLFSAINLYLFFNHYYDKNRNSSKIGTGDVSTILLILLSIFIPIIFYISTHKYLITYYILFGYSFFNYIIVYLAKSINDLLLKIIIRRSNDK